eukprot:TRINITY_DN6669_c0_g1_i1.p1 TRINITY_DN6669_c0_g1~~TRINITY_DN6669_c0_g1_i1.p1  ORF type:complete len:65 (+),score=2.06 TRINITY_DN6669_c0_g1_i1:113-307(+)
MVIKSIKSDCLRLYATLYEVFDYTCLFGVAVTSMTKSVPKPKTLILMRFKEQRSYLIHTQKTTF